MGGDHVDLGQDWLLGRNPAQLDPAGGARQGSRAGPTTDERDRIKALERDNLNPANRLPLHLERMLVLGKGKKSRPLSVVTTPLLGPSMTRTIGRPMDKQSELSLAKKSMRWFFPDGAGQTSGRRLVSRKGSVASCSSTEWKRGTWMIRSLRLYRSDRRSSA